MVELTGTQRKYLRGLAHDLRPVVQIGKNGLNQGVFLEMERALEGHELVKVKFVDCKDQKKDLCPTLAERSRSGWVGLIGNVAIFYRPQEDEAKRRIHPPQAALSD